MARTSLKRSPKCPCCGSPLRTRTSEMHSPDIKRIYRKCTNSHCGILVNSWQCYESTLNGLNHDDAVFSSYNFDCYEA
ncbi:TPA: ogr/Delta-like zinc finger family protein [Serratia marcescens]